MAKSAFNLVYELEEIFQDENKYTKFHIDHTRQLEKVPHNQWIPLRQLTHLPWFTRAWIVQEIGTKASATLFWGDEKIQWDLLHSICMKLTDYYHLRKHFNIQTDRIKYVFQRFIEPPLESRHANRFNFMYELQRARHLRVSDQRDHVFAMLCHFSVQTGNKVLEKLHADYTKTVAQVYVDVAVRALTGDPSLITLATIQHPRLPSSKEASNITYGQIRAVDENTLPSWVPNWSIGNQAYLLSEPISSHCAHGTSTPKLSVNKSTLVLSIRGMRLDVIEALSEPLAAQEFPLESSGRTLAIETLWREVCGQGQFNLEEKYVSGESAFFAYTQTLSNGCISTASRDTRPYHKIPSSEWIANGAAYLTKVLRHPEDAASAIHKVAASGDYFKWSRAANGASNHRVFARTVKGYFVLGPKVLEVGDIVCVLFGGKMPFCLRPCGNHHLLVGECYVHGFMRGEAMEMLARGEVAEQVFDVI